MDSTVDTYWRCCIKLISFSLLLAVVLAVLPFYHWWLLVHFYLFYSMYINHTYSRVLRALNYEVSVKKLLHVIMDWKNSRLFFHQKDGKQCVAHNKFGFYVFYLPTISRWYSLQATIFREITCNTAIVWVFWWYRWWTVEAPHAAYCSENGGS